MRRLLILGAGRNQLPLYRAALAMGVYVIALDPSANAPAFAHANAHYVCDLLDVERCIQIAKQSSIDGVMTIAADLPVPTLARIVEVLGLAGLSPEAARLATDKAAMRDAFVRAGVPSPRSAKTSSAEDVVAAASNIGGTVIIKPALSSGGRGVTAVSALRRSQLYRALEHSRPHARDGVVLVEELADGPEYSVETLTHSGKTTVVAITDKLTSGAPHFVELGHSQPAAVEWAERDQLAATAVAAIQALGIDNSPSHVEIRLTSRGPRVIEVGARMGGGFIASHLVQLSTGIDFLQAGIRLALGEDPPLPDPIDRGAAMRFLTARPGRILRIAGVSDAHQAPGVVEATLYAKPGDTVSRLTDATGRLGHVICSGSSAAEAIQNAERARDLIAITTVD
jgi:biotin carboxylase